jgi:hypothetical protein
MDGHAITAVASGGSAVVTVLIAVGTFLWKQGATEQKVKDVDTKVHSVSTKLDVISVKVSEIVKDHGQRITRLEAFNEVRSGQTKDGKGDEEQ